jgi:hypothetical protein
MFRHRISSWSEERWPPAEQTAYRVGTEGRAFQVGGHSAPAVVWSATCIEIILRELTLKPIFVGLFLGGPWADGALQVMLGRRWVMKETRKVAKDALLAVVGLNVEELEVAGVKPWNEITSLLDQRNRIVHHGATASPDDARRAVDVSAALYAALLPPLRDLCGLTSIAGYSAPHEGAAP